MWHTLGYHNWDSRPGRPGERRVVVCPQPGVERSTHPSHITKVIRRVKTEFGLPTAAYSVSGEHAMIKAAAANGWIDERNVTLESLLAMRRAGADILITYAALDVAKWLKG